MVHSEEYDLAAINFTTYGATLVYLDAQGRRLTPLYNYLKHVDEYIPEVSNADAPGAASIILSSIQLDKSPLPDLGLIKVEF